MKKVVCFGELLLRLSPVLGREWIRNNQMPVFVGGAELNVANALSVFGTPVDYLTALPDNYMSHEILADLGDRNIGAENILLKGERIGSYFLAQGTDMKGGAVIYDRDHSAFAGLRPGDINWELVLRDAAWLHFTAINPALNADVASVCLEAAQAANRLGITLSIDLNYRSRLWRHGRLPSDVMPSLVQHCDVLMGNVWAAETMLGISMPSQIAGDREEYIRLSAASSSEIMKRNPRCRAVANTFRFDGPDGSLTYYATLYNGRDIFSSRVHETAAVVDRVGSGDTFMAGLIYSMLRQADEQQTIEFAAAAAFDKLFIRGDCTTSSPEKIRKKYLVS